MSVSIHASGIDTEILFPCFLVTDDGLSCRIHCVTETRSTALRPREVSYCIPMRPVKRHVLLIKYMRVEMLVLYSTCPMIL